jgi:hypothetical protein
VLGAGVSRPPHGARRWLPVLATGAAAALALAFVLRPESLVAGERAPAERETVRLGARAILVMEGGARARWRPDAGGVRVEQTSGSIFYRVEKGPFLVETSGGTVRVQGTCFRVEVRDMLVSRQAISGAVAGAALASAVLVTVYEGRVSLASHAGQVEVGAGERAALPAAGAAGPALIEGEPPGPAPSATPASPAGRPEATPEVVALRARVAEQERELARLRAHDPDDLVGGAKDLKRFIDPGPEELAARAQRCSIAFNYPDLDRPQPQKVSDQLAGRLGLSDTERQAADEALEESQAHVATELRKLYVEMGGDGATAARLAPSALLSEILQKAPEGASTQARAQLSRERAGLVNPPLDPKGSTVVERALRLMVGLGDDFDRRLGERVGADRARSLHPLREEWRNASNYSGCPKTAP